MIVRVYTKPACQPCKATLRRIVGPPMKPVVRPGVTVEILSAEEHLDLLREWNMTEAPVVEVVPADGETLANGATRSRWSGYRPDLIDSLLPPPEAP